MSAPQQLAFDSLMFPKERSVLTVQEVARLWRVTDRHVANLIEEGSLPALNIAGQPNFVRISYIALAEIARRLGMTPSQLLGSLPAAQLQPGSRRAHYRIPRESYDAYLRKNPTLGLAGK